MLRDAHERPLKRHFVHVDDLVDAICSPPSTIPRPGAKLYNIAMDEPVDYGAVAAHLKATREGLGSIDIPSAYHSTSLDNTRAKLDLNWRPPIRPGLAHRFRLWTWPSARPTIREKSGIQADGRQEGAIALVVDVLVPSALRMSDTKGNPV